MPRWCRGEGDGPSSPREAAFEAGAALLGLDRIVRADPPWLGAWRMRQALAAAEASARLLRLREDASALRDAHHLTRPGDDPGPGGRLHRAWRRFARLRALPEVDELGRLAEAVGLAAPTLPDPNTHPRDPITAAAEAAAHLARNDDARRPESQVFGLMLADVALGRRLGWAIPVPLLAAAILVPAVRPSGERRPRPGEPGWVDLCLRVYSRAAREAHAAALTLARRADALVAAGETIRTRGRSQGIALLLEDDALAAAALTLLGSDRAARRFLDRLAGLGAVRELTGRPTFRLYGL